MSGDGAAGLRVALLPAMVRKRLRGAAKVALPVLLALFLASLVEGSRAQLPGPLRIAGMLVGAGQGIALFWRHSYPRTVMAVTLAGGSVVLLAAPDAVFPYAGMVAIWTPGQQPAAVELAAGARRPARGHGADLADCLAGGDAVRHGPGGRGVGAGRDCPPGDRPRLPAGGRAGAVPAGSRAA